MFARRTSLLHFALGLALVGGQAAPARADAPSAEAIADARLNEAKQKFQEGVRAFNERRYDDAVQAFRVA
ncbi:MAG TPA: hypothetical protein VEQ58_21580, partial [Polyangiaceae bacterium]|nr:hypothetical protein [Polyangiaceae bacterium]